MPEWRGGPAVGRTIRAPSTEHSLVARNRVRRNSRDELGPLGRRCDHRVDHFDSQAALIKRELAGCHELQEIPTLCLVAGNATDLRQDPIDATSLSGALTVTLSQFPALANVGGIARVDDGTGTPIAVARTGTSTFVALSMVCTHQGSTLNIVSGGFLCPNHGATFNASGVWTGGQQTTNLVTFPCTYNASAGTLTIGGTNVTVGSITVSPSTVSLTVGQSQVCTATVSDTSGNVLAGQAVTWTSSNTAIATVSSATIMAVAAGSATITATCGGKSATCAVTVSAGSTTTMAVNPASFPALATVGGYCSVGNSSTGVPVGVCRTATSTYVAYSLSCTHQGTTIQTNTTGGWTCPNHGAMFSSTGVVTKGPATTNLTSFAVTVQSTGSLSIVVTGGSGTGGGGTYAVNMPVTLASFPALATVGGYTNVGTNNNVPVGVCRTGTSTYVAYDLACTHQGTTIQTNSSGGWTCPNHGAQFSSTGALVQGPATTPLVALNAALDSTGTTLTITGSGPAGGVDE